MARDTEQQTPTMQAEPQKEHEWLQKLVGDWAFEVEAPSGPGEAPEKFSGTETVRSLGGLWFLAEGQGEMPGGGAANTIMTLGYDPQKQRFVGTFIASMMTHMWKYEGTLDTEGPGMSGDGKMMKYKDIITFVDDDHRIITSRIQGEDGNWTEYKTAHYRRKT